MYLQPIGPPDVERPGLRWPGSDVPPGDSLGANLTDPAASLREWPRPSEPFVSEARKNHLGFEELLEALCDGSPASRDAVARTLGRVLLAAPAPVARVDVAAGTMIHGAHSQMTQATVSRAMSALTQPPNELPPLLQELAPASDRAGRPTVPVRPHPDTWCVVGIHIEHTVGQDRRAMIGVTNLDRQLLSWKTLAVRNEPFATFLQAIGIALQTIVDDLTPESPLLGVGVSIGGPVENGWLLHYEVGLPPADIVGALRPYLSENIPVVVDNDVNAWASWVALDNSVQGRDEAIIVVFDEGVGASFIRSGRIDRGVSGHAGEIGHAPAFTQNERLAEQGCCGCGGHAHVESYTTVAALGRALHPMTVEDAAALTPNDEGFVDAAGIFEASGRVLGAALAGIDNVVSPGRLTLYVPDVLAPQPGRAASLYLDSVQRIFSDSYTSKFIAPDAVRLQVLTYPLHPVGRPVRGSEHSTDDRDRGDGCAITPETASDFRTHGVAAAAACVVQMFLDHARERDTCKR